MPRHLLLLLLALLPLSLHAQRLTDGSLRPLTRLHAADSPYAPYDDRLLSGFLLSSGEDGRTGFLHMPFLGDPIWLYIGEKDSTQFMAYATGCDNLRHNPATGHISALLQRYKVQTEIDYRDNCATFVCHYPDTTSEKGFLIDLDHSATGEGCDDMEMDFIDRRTVRAHKRSYIGAATAPDEYLFTRFSHPFKTFNIRKEKVKLSDGTAEARYKVAFTFDLAAHEPLTVETAVSAHSSDAAYFALCGRQPARHFADNRRKRPADPLKEAWAKAQQQESRQDSPRQDDSRTPSPATRPAAANRSRHRPHRATGHMGGHVRPQTPQTPEDPWAGIIEVGTLDAALRTGFFTALSHLRSLTSKRETASAEALVATLLRHYPDTLHADASPAATDSLLRAHTQAFIAGDNAAILTLPHTAWYLLNAIGLRPSQEGLRIHRPMFNVATLYYSGNRRFIFHTRGNAPHHVDAAQPKFNGNRLEQPLIADSQLLRGGLLQVTMRPR